MAVQVVNTVTHIVDRLPPDVFEEVPPPSPPSTFSTHESFDSMGLDIPAIPTPANGPDAERNNIIRELVETERKYVQDLEVMQVRMNLSSTSVTTDYGFLHRNMLKSYHRAIPSIAIPSTYSFLTSINSSISKGDSWFVWRGLQICHGETNDGAFYSPRT